ncbi:MAG: beta strand repeat-containing protein [Bacilli bacterium]
MKNIFLNKKWLLMIPLFFFLFLNGCKLNASKYEVSLDTTNFQTVYELDEEIDLSGLIIKRTYKDGTVLNIVVEKNMITGFDNTTLGDQSIFVTYEDVKYFIDIEIIEEHLDQRDIEITNAKNLLIGDELQLAYSISSANGSSSQLQWHSSKPSVANVSNSGLVRAFTSGTTTITVTIVGTDKFTSVDIIVGQSLADITPSITFANSKLDLFVGDTAVLAPVLENITNSSLVTFSSDTPSVVSISGNTATANAVGTAVVSAVLSTDTKVRAYLIFEVTEAKIEISVDILGKRYFQVGNSATLIAVERPYNVDAVVNWTSSDVSVATVDNEGVINPIKKGITDITATLKSDSTISSNYRIYVNDITTVNMSITADSNTIASGETLQLNVNFSSTYYSEIKWVSTNTALATISASGLLTAHKAGNLVVVASAGYNDEFSATYVITISGEIEKPTITITGNDTVLVGDTILLNATESLGATNFAWSSSNPYVATVVNGIVYGVSVGQATIIASLKNDPSIFSTHIVLVMSPNSGETITITGFNELLVSKNIKLTATCSVVGNISWVSSDKNIATVDETGKVTGVSAGVVDIVAFLSSDPTLITSYEIEVFENQDNLTQSIIINNASDVGLGETLQLGYSINFIDESIIINWSSSDNSIISINSSGLLEAKKVGTATITVSIEGSSIYDEVLITVYDVVRSISLIGTATEITVGETSQAVVVVTPKNASYSFASSDENIATVSATGLITAKKGGFVDITVTLDEDETITDTIEIYIIPTSIMLIRQNSYLYVGSTMQLGLVPEGVIVSYTSNHTNMATVNSSGLVTGIGEGSVVITATLTANQNVSSTVTLLIVAAPTITITGPSEVVVANTIDLIVECSEVGTIVWESSDTNKALVNNGSVLGLAVGTVIISAYLQSDPAVKATHQLEVVSEASSPNGIMSITGGNQIIKGEQITLKATCNLEGAITWTTSNSNIAFVNNGVVYGVAQGDVNITAYLSSDEDVSATHSIKVLETGPGSTLTITNNVNLVIGNTRQLGYTINPANSSAVVLWESSNSSVASVSATGLVTAKATGTVQITASIEGTTITNSVNITVTETEVITITITGAHEVNIEETITLLASASNGGNVTWTSSNSNVAIVNNGIVYGVAEGVVNIKAALSTDANVYATHEVAVTNNSSSLPNVYITNSKNITVNEELQLGYVIDPANPNAIISWSSSNVGVASVTSGGLVKGVSTGNVTIYLIVDISGDEIVAFTNISVSQVTPTVTISGLDTVEVAEQITLTATSNVGGAIQWSSSDNNVAFVNNGVVTGVSAGVVTITAYLVNDPTVYDTILITVTDSNPPEVNYTITITGGSNSMKVGQTMQLGYTITPENESLTVKWSTSNPGVATVDENGLVRAYSIGKVTIYAEIDGTSFVAQKGISVTLT